MSRVALVATILAIATPAIADDFCRGDRKRTGKAIDLDLKDADLHDVLRLLVDVGKLNLVVPEGVRGKVSLHLKRVPWDSAICAVAATHALSIARDGTILLVTAKSAAQR